jgi:hypothetical protein
MRILPFLLAVTAITAAATPASAAERRYSVVDFDRVQVDGPYRVTLVSGTSSSARATGSQAALDRVSVEVQGRTLRIRANRSAWTPSSARVDGGPVTVELTTRDLAAASVNGSGTLHIDRAKGLKVDLVVTGSGRLSVGRVDVDNLSLGLVGSGRMILAGRARQLRASVQGSGDLEADALTAEDAVLLSETAGRVAFSAARTAKVRAGGMGEVEIGGKASCDVVARGGPVRCGQVR